MNNTIVTILLSIIALLGGAITYFVKNTYDSVNTFKNRIIDIHVKLINVENNVENHILRTTKMLMETEKKLEENSLKSFKSLSDISDDVRLALNDLTKNQEQLKTHSEALSKALEIFKSHDARISKNEKSIQKIGHDLYIIKSPSKSGK